MTRDDVLALLRRRWRSTDQRFDEETVDVWWEQLGDIDTARAFRALKATIDGGATKVALGDICRLAVDRPKVDVQHRYEFGSENPEHPDYREPGCECHRDTKGTVQLCTMHTERATRWLGIIERGREQRRTSL